MRRARALFAAALMATASPGFGQSPPAGAGFSFVAIDTSTGEILSEVNGDRLGTPASVTKLVVALAALELLGPQYRARTRIEAVGSVANGVLEGDLVIRAVADPTWSVRFDAGAGSVPRRLARTIAGSGLKRVRGAIVVDRSFLPGRVVPVERSWSDLGWGRGAPTSALALEDNAVEIEIGPGTRVGASAFATGPRWLTIHNEMQTVGPEYHGRGTVDALASPTRSEVVLRGEYPISEPAFKVKVAVPDPDRRTAEVLLSELVAAGIEVEGGVRLTDTRPTSGTELATHLSPPLGSWLPPILTRSDNWLADMLLRHLGVATGGSGRIEDSAGTVQQVLLDRFGSRTPFALEDGSGLTPTGVATARQIAQALASAVDRPWFETLVEALPRSGEGTLRGWPRLPAGARAKTGMLRRHVALAGYLPPRDGRTIAFAAMVGPILDDRDQARRWIAGQLEGVLDPPSQAFP